MNNLNFIENIDYEAEKEGVSHWENEVMNMLDGTEESNETQAAVSYMLQLFLEQGAKNFAVFAIKVLCPDAPHEEIKDKLNQLGHTKWGHRARVTEAFKKLQNDIPELQDVIRVSSGSGGKRDMPITAAEAAQRAGISKAHLAKLATEGQIKRIEHGKYDLVSLNQWIATRDLIPVSKGGVTTKTAARLLDCSERNIQKLAREGVIKRLGHGRYCKRSIMAQRQQLPSFDSKELLEHMFELVG